MKKAETTDYKPHYGPPKKRSANEMLERGLKTIRAGAGGHQIDLLEWPEEELPEDFSSSTLQYLSISGGKLRKLPEDFSRRFPNIVSLKVENVPLKECPVGLDRLPKLTDLRLIDTGLVELPDVRLEHLSHLDVSGNRLVKVPDGWFASKTLGGCRISNNRLERLPDGLAQCRGLQSLDVSTNGMKRFDAGEWPDLVQLSMDENRLTELPLEIGNFRKMKYLHLAGNHLTKLPDSMAAMTELVELRLSFNDLKSVPEFLAKLQHLRYAGLDGNLIPQDELKAFEMRKQSPPEDK